MCRVINVHRSGFDAWHYEPLFSQAKINEVLTSKIKEFDDSRMSIYDNPLIFWDLRGTGVVCSESLVAKLMRSKQIRFVRGYKRPRYKVGKPSLVVLNKLQRQF
jgi:putative transposase